MKSSRVWAAVGAVALVAGCAVPSEVADVNRIKKMEATAGTPFTQALFQEYQAYARHESEVEAEWSDAAHFARKGMRAANGEAVEPDDLSLRPGIPGDRFQELVGARDRLTRYLAEGAADRVPASAAKAQVMFDCWAEEEAEKEPASTCRKTFLAVEPDLKKPAPVVQTIPEYKGRGFTTFTVNFPTNSAALSPEAQQTINEVVAAQARLHPQAITVEGHTDTVGSADRNASLSAMRARAVADELARRGVNAALATHAFGEDRLAVPTGKGVSELRNRRVDVVFEHGGLGEGFGYNYGHGGCAYGYGGAYGYGYGAYNGSNGYAGGYYRPNFVVFFDFNSSKLSPEAIKTIEQAVAAQNELKPQRVLIEGHADGAGHRAANDRISHERAQAVANAIANMGGKIDSIGIRGVGATEPTGANINSRRVEIIFDRW